jgi:hypothetical protein
MAPSAVGDLRLRDGGWITATRFAVAIGVPARTARRYLLAWHEQGVRGVRIVPGRGRYGRQLEASTSLAARWRRGELPAPFGEMRAAA